MPVGPQFDWSLAEALYDDGYTISEISRAVGATNLAVARVVRLSEEERRRRARTRDNHDQCACGRRKIAWSEMCEKCFRHQRQEAAYTRIVGPDEDGFFWLESRCSKCGEWKIWTDFPTGQRAPARGWRKTRCRACDNAARKAYRDRHKIPCTVCGGPMLPANDRGRRGAGHPFCRECWQHSDDPRVVVEREDAARRSAQKLRARRARAA